MERLSVVDICSCPRRRATFHGTTAGDEPRGGAVPQVVESQPLHHVVQQPGPDEGRAPAPSPEERAAERTARRVGEHLSDRSGRIALTVRGQQLDTKGGRGTSRRPALDLWIGLVRHRARRLDGDPFHPYGPGVEADGVPAQAHALTPAQAGAGGEADGCPMAARDVGSSTARSSRLMIRSSPALRRRLGSRTPSHGLAPTIRSRTADLSTVDSSRWHSATVAGARRLLKSLTLVRTAP